MSNAQTPEHRRLAAATGRAEDDLFNANPWYEWGPYLSERAWGTVREDYSESGDGWDSFPHDHARSRAYRWNEDGMAGISDIRHELCLALALWNGNDAIMHDPELELLDTGVFDDNRYWSVDVTYAKASPTEVLMRIELENHGAVRRDAAHAPRVFGAEATTPYPKDGINGCSPRTQRSDVASRRLSGTAAMRFIGKLLRAA